MNPMITKIALLPALLFALALGVVGCGTTKPKPVAWTIKITKPAAIEVDLVGVTAREKPLLEAYSMDKYWSPGDLERKNADKLTSPPQKIWEIDRKNAIWERWLGRNMTGFFVIANLPGNWEGVPEKRREFLTLDKKHWDANRHTLEIEVQENQITVVTPEMP